MIGNSAQSDWVTKGSIKESEVLDPMATRSGRPGRVSCRQA